MPHKLYLFSLVIILGAVVWGVSYHFFNRVRKAYKNLRNQVGQVQQSAEKMQKQIDQMQQQMQQQIGRIQQHLLLEHMSDVAAWAKEMDLIDPETFNKSIRALHALEMDNLQGEKLYDSEGK